MNLKVFGKYRLDINQNGVIHSVVYITVMLSKIGYERSLMVRWVIGSILYGGPIELFLVPASTPRLV